jgi:SPP1 family predicted phage head-tail adaptor
MKAGRVRAGSFTKALTLQQRATSTDAEGTPAEGWVNIGPLRAEIQSLGGREFAQGGQLEVRLSHQVKTYWRQDLARTTSTTGTTGHNMRLLWGSRVLDIELVEDPDGRQHVLELLCLERQD